MKAEILMRLGWTAAAIAVCAIVLIVPGSRHAVLDFFHLGSASVDADAYYTCPMHPEIRLPQMGDCPICGMSLVEKTAGDERESGRVSVSPQQVQLTGVTVEPARRRNLSREIEAYGKVDYDETRLGVVSAWVDGRIDELFVDFTGVTVHKGHALVSLYSPKLISSENEYLLALDNLVKARSSGRAQFIRGAEALVESTKQRLLRWGLSESQLLTLAKTREVGDHITIYAPQGGTVIHKEAYEGQYVKEGDVLFHIADLSTVWLYAEIYEEDLPFLYQDRPSDYYSCPMHRHVRSDTPGRCPECGMDLVRTSDEITVEISSRAFPGETFEGRIAFTDPFLNPETRTVRLRVNIENPGRKLKPNMFARARIALPHGETLAVPENAVIQSGERSIVLVEEEPGKFRPQPVRLGHRWLDDLDRMESERRDLTFRKEALRYHEVLEGIEEGETVVTSGNFLLGSESQLQGALAKMIEEAEGDGRAGEAGQGEEPEYSFVDEPDLAELLDAYYAIASTLTRDSIEAVNTHADKIAQLAKSASIRRAAEPLRHAHHKNDLDATRDDFEGLSAVLVAYVAAHKADINTMPLKAYCPMVDANWLQKDGELLNPYLGSKMLHCGKFQSWDS